MVLMYPMITDAFSYSMQYQQYGSLHRNDPGYHPMIALLDRMEWKADTRRRMMMIITTNLERVRDHAQLGTWSRAAITRVGIWQIVAVPTWDHQPMLEGIVALICRDSVRQSFRADCGTPGIRLSYMEQTENSTSEIINQPRVLSALIRSFDTTYTRTLQIGLYR